MNFRLLLSIFFLCFFSSPIFAEEHEAPQELATENSSSKKEAESPILKNWDKHNENREKAEDEKFSELWSKTLFLLIIALGALFIVTWVMKHFDRFKPKATPQDAHIQLIEKRMLSQKSCVYLLHVDGHKILITESVNGTQAPYELSKTIPG